ncbi:non-homologous end-joining factor 1 [Amia ocellicauda]|uniref:non-homologous end-joining factor 1 n=1 Tax=Amia ocellicauda TaxID=2972642 RepID=UPI003464B1C7|nr:NHEJ1 factor [Amia calva]
MEVEGRSVGVLLDQPWVPVEIAEIPFLAKVHFGETSYRLLISDLDTVWHEDMNREAINHRAQELNRRLKAPVASFFCHLCAVARPRLNGGAPEDVMAVFSQERLPHQLLVRLKSELAGVPFYWEFRCSPAPLSVVCEQLVRPLLSVSQVLQRQVQELMTLLGRKDAEIQDYRDNGAVLSRGRLETEVFIEQCYKESFFSERLSELCAVQNCYGFNGDIQELYMAVMKQRAAFKRRGSNTQDSPTHTEKTVSECAVPSHNQRSSSETAVEKKPKRDVSSTDGSQEEQTVPLGALPQPHGSPRSAQSSVKPKKKKAKGLFS